MYKKKSNQKLCEGSTTTPGKLLSFIPPKGRFVKYSSLIRIKFLRPLFLSPKKMHSNPFKVCKNTFDLYAGNYTHTV